jgi:hypothetical protein
MRRRLCGRLDFADAKMASGDYRSWETVTWMRNKMRKKPADFYETLAGPIEAVASLRTESPTSSYRHSIKHTIAQIIL